MFRVEQPVSVRRSLSVSQLPELMAILMVALAMLYLLFVPPRIGLADQGDFRRLMAPLGLAYPPEIPEKERTWCWAQTRFVSAECTADPWPLSTGKILTAIAVLFWRMFGKVDFDIGYVAIVNCFAMLAALYVLFRSFECWPKSCRMAAVGISILIFTDSTYLAYFNSFYQEAAVLPASALVLAFFLRGVEGRGLGFIGYFLASLALVISKVQNAPLAFPLAIFGWRFSVARWARLGATLALGLVAVYTYRAAPLKSVVLYNSIFLEVLPHSPDPQGDLVALGLRPELAKFSGQSAYVPGVPFYSPELFPAGASRSRLALFYLARPKRLWGLWKRGLGQSLDNAVAYTGNFEKHTGAKCQAQTHAFRFWNLARRLLARSAVIIPLLGTWLLAPLLWRKPSTWVFSLLSALACMAFFTSVIGDGLEVAKHMFTFNVLFDLLILCSAAAIAPSVAAAGRLLTMRRNATDKKGQRSLAS